MKWIVHSARHRGVVAWLLSAVFTAFYIALYFTEALTPAAKAIGLAGKWDLYGILYTLAVVGGGIHMLRKYGHSRYQVVRTWVVMFVQVVFAFAVPHLLRALHQPEYYLSYFWPLKFEYFTPGYLLSQPWPFIVYSAAGSFLIVPLLGALLGKRWYCSWVCGCGGLANTFGEPWRHLSSKSAAAWKFEKIAIHTVLALCLLLTALLFFTHGRAAQMPALAQTANQFQTIYGFIVLSVLSGVVGVGLYPLGGTRVWCRFFCPMAALLGLVQKAGRFRIEVKQDMCISCGLCSTYCEMGIDVRSYAQSNQSFTRASCVGCGICAEVCPRGVLRLSSETKPSAKLVQIQMQ